MDCDKCNHHSGIETSIEATCKKIEQLEKLNEEKFKSVEKNISNNKELADVKFKSIKDKMADSSAVLEERLEGLNKLREDVTTDRNQFLRKEPYDAKTTTYDNWIITVEKRFSTSESRAATWTAAIGLFFLLVQIAMYWLKK